MFLSLLLCLDLKNENDIYLHDVCSWYLALIGGIIAASIRTYLAPKDSKWSTFIKSFAITFAVVFIISFIAFKNDMGY